MILVTSRKALVLINIFFCLWACSQTKKILPNNKPIVNIKCNTSCNGFDEINQRLSLPDSTWKCIKRISIYRIDESDSLHIKKLSKQLQLFPNLEELELSFVDNYFSTKFNLLYNLPIKKLEIRSFYYAYSRSLFRNITAPYTIIERSPRLEELIINNIDIDLFDLIPSIDKKRHLKSLDLDAITGVSLGVHTVLDSLERLEINFGVNANRDDYVQLTLQALSGAKRLKYIDIQSSTSFKLPDKVDFPCFRIFTTNRSFDSLSVRSFLEPFGKYWNLNESEASRILQFRMGFRDASVGDSLSKSLKEAFYYYSKRNSQVVFYWPK
jgi:hypothetical protein